jgi:TctA family transporter
MKILTTLTVVLLVTLGLVSFVMAIIGMSLTPLVLGGVLLGLGVLIFQQQRQNQTMKELAQAIRYNAYVQDGSKKTQQPKLDEPITTVSAP